MLIKRLIILGTLILCLTAFSANSANIVAREVYGVGSGLNNQRTIVRDSEGNLYVAYPGFDGFNYQIFVAFSEDRGESWESEWAIITEGELDNIQVTLAIDSHDTLHLVWCGNLSANDADLMYRRYPGGVNTVICTQTGYPGAHCPSLAVGPDDDLHVVYSGCPQSWLVRYLHYDRRSGSWEAPVDIGTHTPSRWPSVEVNSDNEVHVIYRNQPAAHYQAAHRACVGGIWQPVEQIDAVLNSMEYTSIFIDENDHIHAVWLLRNTFYGNPDTIRYRRYAYGDWEEILTIFGIDTSLTYSGDVVVDAESTCYVFYHDFDSCYMRRSCCGGTDFEPEITITTLPGCKFPNARGSKYPYFNRVESACIDFVYTWRHPDSTVNYLMYDNLCPYTPETTAISARFIFPEEGSYTSCQDQSILISFSSEETMIERLDIPSLATTTEYFDTLTDSWRPAVEVHYSGWGSYLLPGSSWLWDSTYSGSIYYRCLTFRSIFETPPGAIIDSAFVTMYADNSATFLMNGIVIGMDDDGSTWNHAFTFDMLPYMHGGIDTLSAVVCDLTGVAVGFNFLASVFYRVNCEIDSSSIIFSINSERYELGDGYLNLALDTLLVWTPLEPLEDGDTLNAFLIALEDNCGGILETPISRTFYVDLSPPVITNIIPPPGSMADGIFPTIQFCLNDQFSGVDTSSLILLVDDSLSIPSISWNEDHWEVSWTPEEAFSSGGEVRICLIVTDSTDYCADNILDTCWYFMINTDTLFLTLPETSAYAGDTILIPVYSGDVSGLFITSISMCIWSDPAVLQPLGIQTPGSILGSWSDINDTITESTICLEASGTALSGDSVLVFLKYVVNAEGYGGLYSSLDFDLLICNEGSINTVTQNGILTILWNYPEWLSDLVFSSPIFPNSNTLTFGVSRTGSEGFDPGLDIIWLPSGEAFMSCFPLDDTDYPHIQKLDRDIRYSRELPVTWLVDLKIDPESASWEVEWFPEYLPEGKLEIYKLDGPHFDMHTNNVFRGTGNDYLFITYSHPGIATPVISLEYGWNLISFPVIPTGSRTFGELLPAMAGAAYWYNPLIRSYEEKTFPEAGKGYWIFSTEPAELIIGGMEVDHYVVPVYPGWNLIGVPFSPVGTVPTSTDCWGFDHEMGRYEDASGILELWKGYWYFSGSEGTLSADSTGLWP
ncbi:hypothetical protein JW877_10060 [bacterium]|nr:hypothetical protein [bacterium]